MGAWKRWATTCSLHHSLRHLHDWSSEYSREKYGRNHRKRNTCDCLANHRRPTRGTRAKCARSCRSCSTVATQPPIHTIVPPSHHTTVNTVRQTYREMQINLLIHAEPTAHSKLDRFHQRRHLLAEAQRSLASFSLHRPTRKYSLDLRRSRFNLTREKPTSRPRPPPPLPEPIPRLSAMSHSREIWPVLPQL